MKFQHISKIEYIDDNTDYYDLSVPKTNNYCLSNGMVVHNTGFGYSVQQHHIEKLPVVVGPSDKTRRFLVGDSIEGWADAIKVLIKAYTTGKSDPIFDYRDIRPKGAKLITAGGKAPGPDPLRICIDQIRAILNDAIGRKLTSLECHDILCHIADSVLSGGIRRCLDKNSFVFLSNGATKKLDEVEIGDSVDDGTGNFVKVKNIFDNGVQSVQKIHLENDTYFECTLNHYWYVYNHDTNNIEWVRTDKLSNGNYSMVKKK